MTEVCWSVHKDSKKLDRVGCGVSGNFWCIDHSELTDTINFELLNNNFVWAAGSVWHRKGFLPMGGGGAFSA